LPSGLASYTKAVDVSRTHSVFENGDFYPAVLLFMGLGIVGGYRVFGTPAPVNQIGRAHV
jgi:hypothetical protein